MKNKIILSVILVGALSCSTNNDVEDGLILEDAGERFSQILSEVVSNEELVREFIREESLKQFDKDYDVFYPLVKDKCINGDKSFKDYLVEYSDERTISKIEGELPLLNIYVPDYSWIGAFSVNSWNPSEGDIAVAYKKGSRILIYISGSYVGDLEENEYPDFPVLIIKNNERLRYNRQTKSGEQYSFIDDVFDKSKTCETKVEWREHYDQLYEIAEPDNYVSPEVLDERVISAYNEFKGDDTKYQRDFVYFGLSNNNSTGRLNTYIREFLYKFRFANALNGGLYDTKEDANPEFVDGHMPSSYDTKRDSLSLNNLRNKDFRIEGNLEMQFYIISGNKNGASNVTLKVMTIPFNELFTYDKVRVEYRHKRWFSPKKWVYSLDEKCLVPLWYVANLEFPMSDNPVWNIGETSTNVKIKIVEMDSGEIITSENEFTYNTATNVTTSSSQSSEGYTVKNDYSVSQSTSHRSKYSVSLTNGSDELGEVVLSYTDPVISGQKGDKYLMRTYSSSDVELMIMPRHI